MKAIESGFLRLGGEAYARAIKNYARLHDVYYRPGVIGRAPLAALPDWPGDWEGRTILALSLYARALHTWPAFLDRIVEDVRCRCNEDGYRGEVVDEAAISEQIYPSHSWLMRGLIEYYRLTGKESVLEWIHELLDKLFLPVYPHLDNYPLTKEDRQREQGGEAAGTIKGKFREWRLSSDIGCILIPLDGLTAAYELTGREDLLPLIYRIIGIFRATDPVESRLQTHASLTFMRGVLRLWRLTGDGELLRMAEDFFAKYKLYGMTCFWANFNWFMRPSWTEPCAVIDSYMLAHQLWEATGRAEYLNDSQMILYNGFYRGQRPNGGFGCDLTGESGFLETRRRTYEARWCCTMRAGEGLSYLARTAVYEDGEALVFPVFSDLEAELPCARIAERAEYPMNGRVTLTVTEGDGSLKEIRLFAPERCADFAVSVNGEPAGIRIADGFVHLQVRLTAGTRIRYTFTPLLHAETVTNRVYEGGPRQIVAYGCRILGADGECGAADPGALERVSDEEWRSDATVWRPIANAYLMEKEDLVESRFGIMWPA